MQKLIKKYRPKVQDKDTSELFAIPISPQSPQSPQSPSGYSGADVNETDTFTSPKAQSGSPRRHPHATIAKLLSVSDLGLNENENENENDDDLVDARVTPLNTNGDSEAGETGVDADVDVDVDVDVGEIGAASTEKLYSLLSLRNDQISNHIGDINQQAEKTTIGTGADSRGCGDDNDADLVKMAVMYQIKQRLFDETYSLPHWCKQVSIGCIAIWSILCCIITTIWCLWFEVQLK